VCETPTHTKAVRENKRVVVDVVVLDASTHGKKKGPEQIGKRRRCVQCMHLLAVKRMENTWNIKKKKNRRGRERRQEP
jgi:hypothetical protein